MNTVAPSRNAAFSAKGVFYTLIALAFAFLCLNTQTVYAAVGRAVSVCVRSVIPSLLPFMIVSGFAVRSGFMDICGCALNRVTRALFNVGGVGGVAFLTGALSGFPLGADCAVRLYKKGSCTRDEAERMIAFCNNTGPAFVIGGVGMAMRGSVTDGVIIYVSQLAAAVLCGFALRFTAKGAVSDTVEVDTRGGSVSAMLGESVRGASDSLLGVCVYVAFFSVLCAAVKSAAEAVGLVLPPVVEALLFGLLEITNGCSFAASVDGAAGVAVSAAVTGWSGLSVLLQTASVANEAGLSVKRCAAVKGAQAVVAAVLAFFAASVVRL